jgi:hypothetical protein
MSAVPLTWLPAGKTVRGAVLWQAEGYDLAIADHPARIDIVRLSAMEICTIGARSLAWAKELVALWWGEARLARYRIGEGRV